MDRAGFLKWLGGSLSGRLMLGARGLVRNGEANVPSAAALPERRLGRTGVMLPILGLGGWHFGDAGSERSARELLETALAEGIRFSTTPRATTAARPSAGSAPRSRRWVLAIGSSS